MFEWSVFINPYDFEKLQNNRYRMKSVLKIRYSVKYCQYALSLFSKVNSVNQKAWHYKGYEFTSNVAL